MTGEREKLLTRVSKLLNMASGSKAIGNIEEGAAFAAKAQEMLLRHGLSMTEIEAFTQRGADPMNEEAVDPEDYKGKRYAKPLKWQVILSEAIAHSYGGVSYYWDRSNTITFVGRDSTRPVMVYVYSMLARVGPRLMAKARKEARAEGVRDTGFEGSYMIGFARAIRERLLAEREELERRIHDEAKAAADKDRVSTALVRIRNQPQEARDWYNQKHFPPPPPLSEEEKAERERRAESYRKQTEQNRAQETPAERRKRESREARERKRWAREDERNAGRSPFAESNRTVHEAVERGYKDGHDIQIHKGLDEGKRKPTKGHLSWFWDRLKRSIPVTIHSTDSGPTQKGGGASMRPQS